MTEVTLGDRTMSLPDLPRLDLPRPDVSLPDIPIREFTLPEFSLPEFSLPEFRRRSSMSLPTVPMVLMTLAAGLVLGITIAAIAWSLAPVRQTAQRIRGRFNGPSWTHDPESEFLENPIAGRPRDGGDSPASSAASTMMAPAAKPATATPAAATPSATPKAASPNGSSPAGRPVSPRSTVALDPGQPS